MKIFVIILLSVWCLYLIVFYVWPLIFALSLRCLSERNLEAYLIKCYRKFQNSPRNFDEKSLAQLLTLSIHSYEFWNELKNSVHESLAQETNAQEKANLQNDIIYCDQKIDFWGAARNAIQQEIKRREYFNSFRN